MSPLPSPSACFITLTDSDLCSGSGSFPGLQEREDSLRRGLEGRRVFAGARHSQSGEVPLLFPSSSLLTIDSRFVFPDGSSYQSKDKDNQQAGGLSSASVTTTPALSASAKGKGKPSLFAKHKPTGDSEHHQRLANDIIKYNSQLFSEPSPAPASSSPVPLPAPAPVPAPVPATVAAHKPRPKSSSSSILGGDETIASTVHSPSGHRSRSSQELKRSSASSQQRQRIPQPQQQLSGSSSSATSQLTLSRGDKQRGTEREANDSEIGIDFDVDRAFRRNRSRPSLPFPSPSFSLTHLATGGNGSSWREWLATELSMDSRSTVPLLSSPESASLILSLSVWRCCVLC
jgi:hypothetical protein